MIHNATKPVMTFLNISTKTCFSEYLSQKRRHLSSLAFLFMIRNLDSVRPST